MAVFRLWAIINLSLAEKAVFPLRFPFRRQHFREVTDLCAKGLLRALIHITLETGGTGRLVRDSHSVTVCEGLPHYLSPTQFKTTSLLSVHMFVSVCVCVCA